MNDSMYLDPKRAEDPEVIQAYLKDHEACRPMNFGELDLLNKNHEKIKRELDSIPRKKSTRARIRVLTTKLRGAEGALKNWLGFNK
jgi:hypothetical protein